MPEKTKAERLKETISMLTQLKDTGIPDTDSGYLEVKALMTEWVNTGAPSETIIEFPRHGRRGTLTLPRKANRAAGLALKTLR